MAGVKSELGPSGRAIAATIRHHRERLGWGYAQLSRQLTKVGCDIPPLGLGRIEAGERRVDVDALTALAVVFEVSPITLLMPRDGTTEDTYVQLTGTGDIPAQRVWSWLNGSYPLSGSVLAFYNEALPRWERDAMEETLGAHRR